MAEVKEPAKISTITSPFLLHAEVELGFRPQSLAKYRDCLRQIARLLGDRPVTELEKPDVLLLKSRMLQKGHSVGRQTSILAALKRILCSPGRSSSFAPLIQS